MSSLDKQEVQEICEHTALCTRKWSGFIYVNERQKIRHFRARSTEVRRKKNAKSRYFTSCIVYVNYSIIVILYTYSIGNQPYNSMVVFKMCNSVPSTIYSIICNVLRLWSISFIPTYRVYRIYGTLLPPHTLEDCGYTCMTGMCLSCSLLPKLSLLCHTPTHTHTDRHMHHA